MAKVIEAAERFRRHAHERTEASGAGGGDPGSPPPAGELVELDGRRLDFEEMVERDRAGRKEYALAVRALRRAAKKYPLLFASERFEMLCILRWGAHPGESMEQAVEHVRASVGGAL